VLWTCLFSFATRMDFRGEKERLRRKTLRGTSAVGPETFNRCVRGDGLGIPCLVSRGSSGTLRGQVLEKCYLRIPSGHERRHFLVCGDTGMGKSSLMHDFLCQIRDRLDESVIVYDPALEFWECHFCPAR